MSVIADRPLPHRLAESLYAEALLLADETRAYFDGAGRPARDRLAPRERVTFACEALKATTRLLHLIGWLARCRADDAVGDSFVAAGAASDAATLARLPDQAARLIRAGLDLTTRVERLATVTAERSVPSPARALLQRLERAF